MADFLKLALIGGAGYVLYQTGLLSSLTGGLIPAPGSASPSGQNPTSSPTNPVAPGPANPTTPPPDVKSLVNAAVLSGINQGATTDFSGAKTSPLLPADDWNYYYTGIRGVQVPSFQPLGYQGQKLSLDEWWSYLQKTGLNGLGVLAKRGFMGLCGASDCSQCECAHYVRPATASVQNPFAPSPGMSRWTAWG